MRTVIRLLLLSLTLGILTGCFGSDPVADLAQRPHGVEDEVLTWTIDATRSGPRHTVHMGIDIDEAQLMGWSATGRPYGILLYATLKAPDGTEQKRTIRMPVTEARQIGEDPANNTIQMSYLPAGEALPSGFRRVPAEFAFSFKPSAGPWMLTVRLKVPPSGERKSLRGVRAVRAELTSRAGAQGLLTAWTEQPPQIPKKAPNPLFPTP